MTAEAPTYVLTDATARAEHIAAQVKTAQRIDLPQNPYWNYGPCEHHETAKPDCEYRACGGDLFDHQTVTAAWLVFQKKALVASDPGTGKTGSTLMALCLLKANNQLGRTLIVINTPAVPQWAAEIRRFAPGLNTAVISPGMSKKSRTDIYASSGWDVMLIGYHLLIKDVKIIHNMGFDVVISDDVDPLRSHKTATHKAITSLADHADRAVVMNASSLATKLIELHASMMPLGGRFIWGALPMFERRYLLKEWEEVRIPGGRKVKIGKVVGVQNGQELRDRLSKWVIRYSYKDLGNDLRMPELMPPTNVWLDLHKPQREAYEQLRSSVKKIQTEEGERAQHLTAIEKFTKGAQICAGLPAMGEPDGPGASVKLDWLEDKLESDWTQEKIVVFARNIGTIRALQQRLHAKGIGFATVWGEDSSPQSRTAEVSRFWEDPNCRVFMGTAAIERSLNLQVANIVVNVDLHLNPERVKQILGRIRRAGSAHSHVYTFNLLATDTQESGSIEVLRKREAVTSFVWGDDETIFDRLSPADLLRLIRP